MPHPSTPRMIRTNGESAQEDPTVAQLGPQHFGPLDAFEDALAELEGLDFGALDQPYAKRARDEAEGLDGNALFADLPITWSPIPEPEVSPASHPSAQPSAPSYPPSYPPPYPTLAPPIPTLVPPPSVPPVVALMTARHRSNAPTVRIRDLPAGGLSRRAIVAIGAALVLALIATLVLCVLYVESPAHGQRRTVQPASARVASTPAASKLLTSSGSARARADIELDSIRR